MLKSRSLVGSLVVVLAFGFLGVSCGGDDGGPLQAQSQPASDDAPASDVSSADASSADVSSPDASSSEAASADDTSAADSGAASGGGGSDTPPQLAQGAWVGTLHFEVSGDVDVSEDLPGGAITQGEFSLLTFAAEDGHGGSQIAFTAGSNSEAAVFVSSGGFTGGGEIGKDCSLSVPTNNDTNVEGSFTCKGVKGVKAASLDDLTVDIQGTFQLSKAA